MTRRRTQIAALALVCVAALAGCGKVSNKPGETVREGLSTPLGGLRYTVFLTRQLNLALPEDGGYLPGYKEAAPGRGLFGVFLEACNKGDKVATASDNFYIEDAQGNRFVPSVLPPQRYPYAYHGGPVPPKNCMPGLGTLAQLGPTSGALLLFNLPLANTENRPLTLHIEAPPGATGVPEATVTLDI